MPGETDEEAELKTVLDLQNKNEVANSSVYTRARAIMERLSVQKPRLDSAAIKGRGKLRTAPFSGSADEIELDKTLEKLIENPFLAEDEILVRERLHTKRNVVLLVDVSGSMKGEKMVNTAATVGALSAELSDDNLAVVAFWSDAALLLKFGEQINPTTVLETLLRLPARGLTNVHFPLEIAKQQLQNYSQQHSQVILLSDCVHNAGPDPRNMSATLPRVDVLLDISGEKDIDLGREIARRGRGICKIIKTYRDVAPAVSQIFDASR